MSELPITPFPPPAGLASIGDADAGVCVDGVCAVPGPPEDGAASAAQEHPDPVR